MNTLGPVAFGATVIRGITQSQVGSGTQVRSEATSGELYPSLQSIVEQKPTGSFTTKELARALDACSPPGVSIATLTGGLVWYFTAEEDGGTRKTGSVHTSHKLTKGLVYPTRLEAGEREDATISYDALATWDGTNDPLQVSHAAALPAFAESESFGLGPATIGGIALTKFKRFSIDFGLVVEGEGKESEIFDRECTVAAWNPRLTLRGIDPAWMDAAKIPLGGKVGIHTDTKVYLRKRKSGGTFEDAAETVHICFTAAGLAYIDSPAQASGNRRAEISLTMPLTFDGTNPPLVIDTTAAIA
jgi:hypothetical protein